MASHLDYHWYQYYTDSFLGLDSPLLYILIKA
jgi:hypothetical protein